MSVSGSAVPRRVFVFRTLSFIPATAAGLAACTHLDAFAGQAGSYTPSFFTESEWRFVNAFVDRLIPHDEVGPGAVEAGVPILPGSMGILKGVEEAL